jgi:hypothetical protein
MFLMWKMFKGARWTAAWVSFVAGMSMAGWMFADHFAHRRVGTTWLWVWLVLSLLVGIPTGVFAIPRWPALVGLAMSALALFFAFR